VKRLQLGLLIALAVQLVHPVHAVHSQVLGSHPIRTDASGKILPWYSDSPDSAYDFVVRKTWDFWSKVDTCCGGVPQYMVDRTWDAWKPEEPVAGIGGDQFAMTLSSWDLLYDYTGDERIIQNMEYIADTYLANGFTSPSDLWGGLPFPINLTRTAKYDGDMIAGKGFLQPDKAASFAKELVILYKKTAQPQYLEAAERIAVTLANLTVVGNDSVSPLPFRVNAFTNVVRDAYTANWAPALDLYRDLTRLGDIHAPLYAQASDRLRSWVLKYPMSTQEWGPFFEDITGYSNTQINAVTVARNMIMDTAWGSSRLANARIILDAAFTRFVDNSWKDLGAYPIREQTQFMVVGNSHTARQASTELEYIEATGDSSKLEQAIRQLHWATYMVDVSGLNRYPTDLVWFTDGYGDYVRHYLRAMAAAPELAPGFEDHLLRASSVVETIGYETSQIWLITFDSSGSLRLRLRQEPLSVSAGSQVLPRVTDAASIGWRWRPLAEGGVLDINYSGAKRITVEKHEMAVNKTGNASNYLRLTPNPARDNVHIAGLAPFSRIEIRDALGRLVRSLSHGSSEKVSLSLNDLSPGVYSISAMSSGRLQQGRFVIER
jgi:hypothetical protein